MRSIYGQVFQDGFGQRSFADDPESGEAIEVLTFAPDLAADPAFAAAVGERVARLSRVRHTLYARARKIERPSQDSLLLYSDQVLGWRLADVLAIVEREGWTIDISAVLSLMRQLLPAVSLFSRHQRDATIGTIGPERLILTPQGRLVIAEYVLAPGVEALDRTRDRLWRELRVAVPPDANPSRMPPSTDVVGIGVVALSLLLGRLLRDDEYLVSLGDLVETLAETSAGKSHDLSPAFRSWLARALQFDEQSAYSSTQEAQVAFEEMLAKERSYVTSAVQLDLFVAKLEGVTGKPAVAPVASAAPIAPAAPVAPIARIASAAPIAPIAPVAPAAPAAPDAPVAPVAPVARSARSAPWLRGALAALAVIALLEAGAIVWLASENTPVASGNGELVVRSRPAAARVSVDGDERGTTPFATELEPGPHVVEVRVGRSEPRVIPVMIRPGIQSGLYVELQSVATVGGLEVRSEPAKARVTVSGQFRGVTPLVISDLPPGEVEVVVQSGKREVRQTVRIQPGITGQLVIPLGQ